MGKWTETDDIKLISLADQCLAVDEIQKSFPDFSEGSIALRLNALRKQKRLPKDFKIRMKYWDEENLIKYVNKGLSVSEIAEKYPGTSINSIIGRLYTLRKEGKIPKDFNLHLEKSNSKNNKFTDNEWIKTNSSSQFIAPCQLSDTLKSSVQTKSQPNIIIESKFEQNQENSTRKNSNIQKDAEKDADIDITQKKKRSRYIIFETPSEDDTHKISFLEFLTKNIECYEGPNKEIQRYCPIFFELLSNILNDKFVDWHTKVMISATLGYFVLEEDVICDTEKNGYIDDLYLVTYVLNEIKNSQSPEIIIRNWSGKENIIRLINDVFIETSQIVGPLSKKILQKVGLYKFSLLSLEEYSGEYPKRYAKVSREKRELIGLLAYIIQKVQGDDLYRSNYEKIKKHVENDENFDEIQRIIEISRLYHKIEVESIENPDDFVKLLEQRMREARFSALKEKKN